MESVDLHPGDTPPPESRSLRKEVVTLAAAATLGVVMLSPAMTLYGNFAASFATAGNAAPLAFVWALLATLPTAASYALLSRDYPASGSAASWTARISPQAGRWLGWMVFLYYLTNFILQPVTFGLFFSDLAAEVGAHPGLATYLIGAVLCCAIPAAIAYRGIAPSTQGALTFLITEAVIVIALCLTAAWQHPSGPLSSAGFHISSAPGGLSGIAKAMVFAMLSYCGFDVVSTLAEEAKMPRKMIPQATFLSLLIFGAAIIGGVWCLTYSASPERLRAMADAPGMPITDLARGFWGRGAVLVMITGITAALGISIATAVGASRILFSMGRDGLAPSRFAQLHPLHRVPWNAMHLVFGLGFAGASGAAVLAGPYQAYLWWGTTSTFFAMLTFVFVNLCNLILFRARVTDSLRGFFLHCALPIMGISVDIFILVRSFFIEAWGQGMMGRSAIAFDVACAAVALFALIGNAPRLAPSAPPA